ncbi:MAG: pectate lyase [Lewinellaceae bacterium]|nr:pectate lyase [Lewinellaceae bacterium]
MKFELFGIKQLFSPMLLLLLIFLTSCHGPSGMPDTPGEEGPVPVQEDPLAFPGAEGFGRDATGGRGGKVLFVTNLNDSGPGSFRAAVEDVGPRYVLFKVSGNIELKSRLLISNGNLTIAGQSAPGEGICVRDYPVVLNADNVIIRFMRFRLGDVALQEADAFEGRFHKNIIIDHCSMSWSVDECLSIYVNENTTVQWCIVSESLNNSVHSKGAHGYGGIWGGKNASFHHNLLANHESRNPRLGESAGDAFALTDLVDMRNNVIYNWGNNSCYGGEAMNVNIVNCYYKPGPATPSSKRERIISIDKNKEPGTDVYDIWGKFYIAGNYVEGSTRATADNWEYGVYNQFHSSYGAVSAADKAAMRLSQEHPTGGNVTAHTPQIAYEKVLDLAGASFFRDDIDARIIETTRAGAFTAQGSKGSTNGIIDSQEDVGGWVSLNSSGLPQDSSGDGMPDDWKAAHKLDPASKEATGRNLSTAYDNLEVYLNSLVKHITDNQE